MTPILARLFPLCTILLVAACAARPPALSPEPVVVPGYEEIQDGEILIQAVNPRYLTANTMRAEVDYAGPENPGSIVVDTHARRLYYVLEGGRAMRYAIAVGREGLAFRGSGRIGRKQEWPSWTPTANMLRTQPETYGDYAAGLPGGLENPLGARALYLYRGGRDSYFRIHGTIDNASIGRATSAGCIRLFNQDAIDLYERTDIGTRVKVRSLEESLELEGPVMDDINGRAIPYDPALAEAIAAAKAEAEAEAAEAAAAEAATNEAVDETAQG